MKTTLTFTRPNTDAAFFSIAQVPESDEKNELLLFLYTQEQAEVLKTTEVASASNLVLFRTVTWKDEESRAAFSATHEEKFQWFFKAREEYLKANGHTMSIALS